MITLPRISRTFCKRDFRCPLTAIPLVTGPMPDLHRRFFNYCKMNKWEVCLRDTGLHITILLLFKVWFCLH